MSDLQSKPATALAYPLAQTADQVDVYHGTPVADPYRWLEDPASADTAHWIDAQRAITEHYLRQLPDRHGFRFRFDELLNYPRRYQLLRVGRRLFYTQNAGLQPQLALCMQEDWQREPEILIDPHDFAPDGAVALPTFSISYDGRYVAFSISRGGSEWHEIHVYDLLCRSAIADELHRVKGPFIAWSGLGFYYTRYPERQGANSDLSAHHMYHQVWYHQLGAAQSDDQLVYTDPDNAWRFHGVTATGNEAMTLMTTADYMSSSIGTAIHLIHHRGGEHVLRPIVASVDAEFRFVGLEEGEVLLFLTNLHAPNWRLIGINPNKPDASQWKELIVERSWPLEQVKRVGDRYVAVYRCNATNQLCELDVAGVIIREIQLPAPGSVSLVQGEDSDHTFLWVHTTFSSPPTVYAYDLRRGLSKRLWPASLPFNPYDFVTTRVSFPSADGTRIPMFLVHRADVEASAEGPVLIYGYGGGGISSAPAFDPLLVALLERGVRLAVPCLRGGGEFGEPWHVGGMRERKQTVFDDCIAAAQWLHAKGLSRPERTALIGGSNGGLLAAAVLTQRPELFGAVIPSYGVMDMLRFQHFTFGHAWIAEYGASDDPAMFRELLAYSPLHNIRDGWHYPPTLVLTSEHDERVVPAHSYKFLAALQAKGAGPGPYLIRIDRETGHTAHNLPKELAERADVYAFLWAHIGDGIDR